MPRPRQKFPVLVTGFEPFGGAAVNPAQEIARALDGTSLDGHPVIGITLPCVFATAPRVLRAALGRVAPGLVVGLGLAAGRTGITPERVAINLVDARIPDNRGDQPVDRPVRRGGPAAYWSTLPVKAVVAALHGARIPAAVSHSAGTFVCNQVFYHLMHALAPSPRVRGGFIHVPALPGDIAAAPGSLPLPTQVAGIRLAIGACLARSRGDLRRAGGEVA